MLSMNEMLTIGIDCRQEQKNMLKYKEEYWR